jgi:peroxiredoxin Q/BCP
MALAPGKPAPAFALTADDGSTISLKDLRGRPVVLFFYPKDDTPTCTKEACAFRDDFPRFGQADAVILGVSPDTPVSHARFRKKYKLPFRLLSDPDHVVAGRYRVWGKKKLFGVSYMGIVRTTFVIDAEGRLRNTFNVTRVAGHSEEVQAAIEALG